MNSADMAAKAAHGRRCLQAAYNAVAPCIEIYGPMAVMVFKKAEAEGLKGTLSDKTRALLVDAEERIASIKVMLARVDAGEVVDYRDICDALALTATACLFATSQILFQHTRKDFGV